MNQVEANAVVDQLTILKYFPSDEGARVALGRLLMRMCDEPWKAQWLADRMIDLFSEWPGPSELRAVYCSKYNPADGIECDSEVYLNGIDSKTKQTRQIGAGQRLAAVAGKTILQIEGPRAPHSDDFAALVKYEPKLSAAICALAEKKRMLEPEEHIDYNTWDDPVAVKLRQMGL